MASTSMGIEMPKRSNASAAKITATPACTNLNSYGRSWMSALARSDASVFDFWLAAIHTGAPVGSNRLRSCSRTSARVRYVTRAFGPALAAARPPPTIP
jgi:hypothetical protein